MSHRTESAQARDKKMDLAERLYEARKQRERVPAEFLPLFDHLLNLATDDYRRGRPQSAGRMLRKAEDLSKRKHSAYYDPQTEYGHQHKRTGYRGHRRFGYLTGRDQQHAKRDKTRPLSRRTSRDPDRHQHEEHIAGLRVTFRYHPRSDLWSGTVHAKHGSGTLPGGSGKTLNAAVSATRHLLRHKHGRH